jgi:chromosome segregation ATPase
LLALQKIVLFSSGALVSTEEITRPLPPSMSLLEELDNERQDVIERLAQVKEYCAWNGSATIREEILREVEICELFQESLDDLTVQTDDIENKISSIQMSRLYKEIQKQREDMVELRHQLRLEKQQYLSLRAELSDVSNRIETHNEEVGRIGRLQKRLTACRAKQIERAGFYISLRQRQVQEIQDFGEACSDQSNTAWTGDESFESVATEDDARFSLA